MDTRMRQHLQKAPNTKRNAKNLPRNCNEPAKTICGIETNTKVSFRCLVSEHQGPLPPRPAERPMDENDATKDTEALVPAPRAPSPRYEDNIAGAERGWPHMPMGRWPSAFTMVVFCLKGHTCSNFCFQPHPRPLHNAPAFALSSSHAPQSCL